MITTENQKRTLVDISHVSKRGSSLRVTLPKKVGGLLSVQPQDIVGFYLDRGQIIIEKMK